ncbi:YciI family protein [Nonomuraea wenchangensis]|uniref:YCII-related domain-containing protein n=1 Tax=Nonomuraea wenchangensis TaxID=568860 RepID=A0A1I0KJW1_9ACTN|nr:hypothetical protein [Nonomuraea wenchangensis]SEU24505.1 hypothetical protein SAMN05421811_108107 [Nonomuraea wenchangensis]
MKFLLIMHNNPLVWDALTEEERQEVMSGHGPFMETARASGELVGTVALADPARSAVEAIRLTRALRRSLPDEGEVAGDHAAALESYREAARRTTSLPEQRYLLGRAAELADRP